MLKKKKSLLGALFAGVALIATVRGAAANPPDSQIPCNLQAKETPIQAAKNIIAQLQESYVDPNRTREADLWAAAGPIPDKVDDALSCEALYAALRRIAERDPHSKLLEPTRFDGGETAPNPVTHHVIKGNNIDIVYIRLTRFSEGAHVYIEDAVRDEMQRNKVQAIVLDLEGNSGGSIEEIGPVAGIFLPKDRLVFTSRDLNGKETAHYLTSSDGIASGYPLAVLVNDKTASAAEAVVAALQHYRVGVIVGQKTFGKATKLVILPQSRRGLLGQAELVMTIDWLYPPSGVSIQKKGIIPDVNVLGDQPTGRREEDLLNPLSNPSSEVARQGAQQSQFQCVTQIDGPDRDLRCGITVLVRGSENGVTVVPTRESSNKKVQTATPRPD